MAADVVSGGVLPGRRGRRADGPRRRDRLLADIDRAYIVRCDDAVEYGLVDRVITRPDALSIAS